MPARPGARDRTRAAVHFLSGMIPYKTLILGLLLRSVVAALYLLGAVTLNYFAALGAASFLFHRIQGDDGIAYAIPLYAFIFLVALGTDYTIFLMTRVREEVGRYGTRRGTQDAVRRTGGVITSA